MKLFKEENIKKILEAIQLDEYDDSLQDKKIDQDDFIIEVDKFLDIFLQKGTSLEIGCGSGDSMEKYNISYGIEPCEKRYLSAKKKGLDIKQNVSECIEFNDNYFDSVIMINGFFQVRSDYESLIEINRVLKTNGNFIVNLLINDNIDIVLGRCYGFKNFIRLCSQFGFSLQAYKLYNAGKRFVPDEQIGVIISLIKERNFDNKYLNLLQVKDQKDLLNYLPERDWKLI